MADNFTRSFGKNWSPTSTDAAALWKALNIPHRQPRYSKEEIARRGTEIYEQHIAPKVAVGNKGKIVAVDIDTGEFEIAEDGLAACLALLARQREAQIWCLRIGYRAVHHFGARSVRAQP